MATLASSELSKGDDVPVSFRISDGPAAAPWLSPDIEPGQAQAGGFNVVAQMTQGNSYDFRVQVHNDGNEDAVPWTESAAVGAFVGPLQGTGGLAWPLSGTGRTIVTAPAGGTRVQLVPQGSQYGLELQSSTGTTIKVLVSTLDPNFLDRRVAVTYSPNGRRVVLLDYNTSSDTAAIDIFLATADGGLAAGTQIMGSGTVPSYSVFLINLTFTSTVEPDRIRRPQLRVRSRATGAVPHLAPLDRRQRLCRARPTGQTAVLPIA